MHAQRYYFLVLTVHDAWRERMRRKTRLRRAQQLQAAAFDAARRRRRWAAWRLELELVRQAKRLNWTLAVLAATWALQRWVTLYDNGRYVSELVAEGAAEWRRRHLTTAFQALKARRRARHDLRKVRRTERGMRGGVGQQSGRGNAPPPPPLPTTPVWPYGVSRTPALHTRRHACRSRR